MAARQVKKIKVCVKNLYKLDVENCAAMSAKVEKVQSHDVGEILHRRLCYLHHDNLNIMQ